MLRRYSVRYGPRLSCCLTAWHLAFDAGDHLGRIAAAGGSTGLLVQSLGLIYLPCIRAVGGHPNGPAPRNGQDHAAAQPIETGAALLGNGPASAAPVSIG